MQKHCLKMVSQAMASVTIILIVFFGGTNLGLHALKNAGIVSSTQGVNVLFKVVIGLNPETRGKLGSDYKDIRNMPRDEQLSECLARIKKYTENPVDVLELMIEKTNNLWFAGDTYLSWYTKGIVAKGESDIEAGNVYTREAELNETMKGLLGVFIRLDTLFLRVVYIFSAVALLLRKRNSLSDGMDLLWIVIMGWVAFFLFTEMQPRYRYPAMPAFMCFAAHGMILAKNSAHMVLRKYRLERTVRYADKGTCCVKNEY